MKIISIKDLSLKYDEFEVLHKISMDIEANAVTALIGASGCGKSSFLRCFNRMNDLIPNSKVTGNIKFKQYEIYANNIDLAFLRQKIGMVFQQPNAFSFSIYDNVAFGLKIQGINKKKILDERVENALKEAAIWDEVKDKLSCNACSLSGGQQQRICIARALATNPEILLMDEPTSALDPISAAKVEETILFLKKKHTIILVTHNIEQAKRVSDNLAFFMSGHLIEYGVSREIFTQAKNKDTKDYLEEKWS